MTYFGPRRNDENGLAQIELGQISLPIFVCGLTGRGCCYFDRSTLRASAVEREPAKGRSDNGGSVVSPMIKLAKDEEEEKESLCI